MPGREYFEPELGLRRLASGLLQEKIQPMSKELAPSLPAYGGLLAPSP